MGRTGGVFRCASVFGGRVCPALCFSLVAVVAAAMVLTAGVVADLFCWKRPAVYTCLEEACHVRRDVRRKLSIANTSHHFRNT